jgi:predicted dehydrogenase
MKRRDFIRDVGILGGFVSSFPWLYSCSSEAKREIRGEKARIGMVGTGSRGMFHINHLLKNQNVEIVAICDNFQAHLNSAKERCPSARAFNNYKDLLSVNDIDGIIISTPLNEHADITIDALQASKHVLCEKSMALTLDDCLNMYNAYKESGKVLYIGQQRLYDPKFLRSIDMIHSGLIGEVTGIRCYWFRNNDWRRPVPEPSLERKINWRLYKEYSGGLMTELATHQIQVGNWAMKMIPETIVGMGDIVFWKDGREVYDNVCAIFRYQNGVKMTYESIISNKFNGLEEQILGNKGTMELEKGKYYFEDATPAPGILQLINNVERGIFSHVPFAGPSWVPEVALQQKGEYVMDNVSTTAGDSSVGAAADGTEELVDAFCHSVITGKPVETLVEEAYYSSVLAILAIQAMEEQRTITFPDEYKIPYLNFK